ncbi:MAG: histidine phosphatase family protein [Lachnospiraceae bacterium]|nr:histidine phosphatase family protein [Lachnospiraceae bacterium]
MIYLVRHGQTAGNRAKVLQGRGSNSALNEEGIRQAQAVREWVLNQQIHFARVYSSPLLRAMQTARIISGGMTAVTDERLLEMDYGPYEGMDLLNLAAEVKTFFSDFVNNPAPDGMEPLSAVTSRMGDFLNEIRPQIGEENILISTHAIAMKGALEYLTPDSRGGYWSRYIGNCAMYAFRLSDGAYTVPEQVRM